MKKKELMQLLNGYGDDEDVAIEYRDVGDMEESLEDGDVLEILDERSVTFSYGRILIIGDRVEE